MNEFVESLFNLETDLLLKRCKDTDEGMIKREKGIWVAPELPIVPYCVLEKVTLFGGLSFLRALV